MARRMYSTKQNSASGVIMALLPLVMVFAAIAFLAVGAKRTGDDRVKAQQPFGKIETADAAAAEEAAAAAVVAISLARVAPALPEEALEPPKPATPSPAPASQQARADALQRDGRPNPSHAGAKPAAAPMQIGKAHEAAPAPAPPAQAKPKDDGILARIGSYAPSPKRIASAVSDGVSRIAGYLPGL